MPGGTPQINTKAVKQNTYDAIVVGSGISGGWAAKELCEKGLKTLVLERGRNINPNTDFAETGKAPWELAHRGSISAMDKINSPIQSRVYAFTEAGKQFFVNDLEHPYNQIKPFDWVRGYHVGGRSIMWGRHCYRWSDIDFSANAKDGFGVDWPIRYKDIESWYDYVEPFVGISGSIENLPQLPDGKFLPPMQMNVLEKQVAQRIKNHYKDSRCLIIGRVANHTSDINGQGICQYRDKCNEGCPFKGYFSSIVGTLPAAKATGNMTLRPFSIVKEVLYDKDSKKAIGVRIIDTETLQTQEYYAKIIFLNASAIASTSILLNSVSDAFPDGMGNSSGQLGHNLMDHYFGMGAYGDTDDFADKYYYGRRPTSIYIPRFRNISEDTKHKDYVRGFSYQAGASRSRVKLEEGIGAVFKEALTEPGKWSFGMGGRGECLPYYENKISLNHDKKDKWGLPTIDFDCEFKDNEKAMRKDMIASAIEMLDAAGIKNIKTWYDDLAPGFCIHEMGTARMGHDPKTSVLNENNQLHEVKNVFITDGACMTSSACQNPSITYMALTARACDFAVKELKKGNL
ncbi:MAG: GMC family oxidoreductase [Ferruginibacter sp.]|nr:GMC family oxidoreductase [Ferruginibacter sp.]